MIFEDRYTVVAPGSVTRYLDFTREQTVPRMKRAGSQLQLLLTSLIGDSSNTILQIARYPDFASWQSTQEKIRTGKCAWIEREKVRLLRSVSSRPKSIIPPEDHRATYTYRTWFINPEDLKTYVRDSEKGVWPLSEALDCRTHGLFATLAATYPMEIILLAGYHGPGHWGETRINRHWEQTNPAESRPASIDRKVWEAGCKSMSNRENTLVRASSVRLWQAQSLK